MSVASLKKFEFIQKFDYLFHHLELSNPLDYELLNEISTLISEKAVGHQHAISSIITKVTHTNLKVAERGVEVLNYIVCNCDHIVKHSFLTTTTLDVIKGQIEGGPHGVREKILEYIPLWVAIYNESHLKDEQKSVIEEFEFIMDHNKNFFQTVNISGNGIHISMDNSLPGNSFQSVVVGKNGVHVQHVSINNRSHTKLPPKPSAKSNTFMFHGQKNYNPGKHLEEQIKQEVLHSLHTFNISGRSMQPTASCEPGSRNGNNFANYRVAPPSVAIPKISAKTYTTTTASIPTVRPPSTGVTGSADDKCIFCYDERKTHACIPCGHKIICDTCFEASMDVDTKLSNCPICRTNIVQILKIYD